MDIPRHDNWQYRDQTLYWSGSDQEEKFKKNLADQTTRDLLINLGWDKPDCITYQFNSHGFRDSQFDSRECGIAFGCSFTQGVGVTKDDTWPSILSSTLGVHIWNLGIGGCALDTIFRISEYYINLLNPKFITLLLPAPWRIEYAIESDSFEILLPNTLQSHDAGNFIKNWFANDINSIVNQQKNILALKYICSRSSIPLYILDTQKHGNDCHARDLLHPGKRYHQYISQMFNSNILG